MLSCISLNRSLCVQVIDRIKMIHHDFLEHRSNLSKPEPFNHQMVLSRYFWILMSILDQIRAAGLDNVLTKFPSLDFLMSKTWNLVDAREPWSECLIEDLRWGHCALGHRQWLLTCCRLGLGITQQWGCGRWGMEAVLELMWVFPKMMVPNNHGFSYENDHFGVFWGYHYFRKHPCC